MKGIIAVSLMTLFLATNSMASEKDQKADLLSLGKQYYEKGEFQKAVDVLTQFIESKPKTGVEDAYNWRLASNHELGKYALVVSDLDAIIPKSLGTIKDQRYAQPLTLRCSVKMEIYRMTEGRKNEPGSRTGNVMSSPTNTSKTGDLDFARERLKVSKLVLSAQEDCEASAKLEPKFESNELLREINSILTGDEYDPGGD